MKWEALGLMSSSDLNSNRKTQYKFCFIRILNTFRKKLRHVSVMLYLFQHLFRLQCFRRLIAIILLITICIFLIQQEAFAAQPHNKPTIKNLQVEGLYSIKKEDMLDLLNLRIGDVLDTKALRTGIKRAFLKGIFDDIIIEGSDDYTSITVRVEEKKILERIEISGNNHFSNRFIKNNLNVKEGDRVSLLMISQSITSVREQMKKGGFPHSLIDYSLVPTKVNRCYLKLSINEGNPEIIKKISIAGHSDTVKSYMSLSEGDIYDETKMEKTRRNILNYYTKQGHVGVFFKYLFQDGILSVELKSGSKLDIYFIGNDSVNTNTLMKEVVFQDINEVNTDIVEEMKSRLLSVYHQRGFPYVEVIGVISESPDSIILNVFISEGTRYRIGKISFTGSSISEEKLKDILKLKKGEFFDIATIESDRETLKEFYNSLGYLEAEVSKPEINMSDDLADIAFFINEGPQTKISKLSIQNNKSFSEDELLSKIPLKHGNPFNDIDISDSRQKILNIYYRAGYIRARVLAETSFVKHSAEIKFIIEEGDIAYFGKNIIVGNERTKPEVIERELQQKGNQPLSYSLVLKEKQKLQRLGLFTDVDAKLSDYSVDNKMDVIYYLDEANHGAIEFGAGYGEYERYRLFMDLSYKNLWGMNRLGSFRTELSSLEQRYILSYTDPWFLFLGSKFVLKSVLLFEDRKEKSLDTKDILYKLKRTAASAGLEKTISENIKADLYYDFSVVKTSDVKPDIILSREDVGTLIISGFRPGLIYDTRDNPFEPGEGVLAGLSFKIASGLFFSETDFAKLIFYGNKYLRLSERIVLAASLRGGIAKGFGTTSELPIVERFFLGGRTTVRGYAQDTLGPKGSDGNPTGGNIFAMANLELRTYIGKDIGLVAFMDGGNVWQKISQADMSGFKLTTGIGLRYKTPAGPIRIDYGHKLNRETGESKGELHFSIGHAF